MKSYLAPVVYQQTMGLSRDLSLILGGATAMTFLAASIVPIWVIPPSPSSHFTHTNPTLPQVIDRYGRRPVLMLSAGGQCFCFAMTAVLLSVGTKRAAYGATAMIFLFQVCIGIGFLPIVRQYPRVSFSLI